MPKSILLNNTILFLCASIYLGTGVMLVFFQLPLETQLTPDNYAVVFVKPVELATQFFTWMTIVMFLTGFVMLFTEWFSGIRWVPIVVLLAVTAATALTIFVIFDLNKELASGVKDQQRLSVLLHEWAGLNRVRAALWVVQWTSMMYWFYRLAGAGRGH
ncbi:MAG TPA: hypothetical protein PLO50_07480 [Nitrospira sp.]|nr:hypothetical protein [Nitrospira sp.]